MWLSPDGRFNTMRPMDPLEYLSAGLVERLGSLSDRELVGLDFAVSRYRDTVIDDLEDAVPEQEEDFEYVDLPQQFMLTLRPGDLLEGLCAQFDETPLRWRFEVVFLISNYVSDHGPKWKKYRKIAKAIERQGRQDP